MFACRRRNYFAIFLIFVMRLDLLRYNCAHFNVSGEAVLTRDQMTEVQAFMSRTLNHNHGDDGDDSGRAIAIFGSRSKLRSGIYGVRGSLSHSSDDDDLVVRLSISYDRASELLPSPPRSVRPVSVLIDSVSQLLGLISIECDAIFEYHQSDGYVSTVQFPAPLFLSDEANGITHIESAEFSSRSGDDILHSIAVIPNVEEDVIVHLVEFQREDVQLNRPTIRALFNENVSISSRLIQRKRNN